MMCTTCHCLSIKLCWVTQLRWKYAWIIAIYSYMNTQSPSYPYTASWPTPTPRATNSPSPPESKNGNSSIRLTIDFKAGISISFRACVTDSGWSFWNDVVTQGTCYLYSNFEHSLWRRKQERKREKDKQRARERRPTDREGREGRKEKSRYPLNNAFPFIITNTKSRLLTKI